MTSTDDNMYFFNCHIKHEMVGIPPKGLFPGEHCRLNLQFLIAAKRQRGSTLFLTAIEVIPESTRPSLSPRYMYSRDLNLCPSVCYDVVFPGELIQLRLLKQGVRDRPLLSKKHLFCFACATHFVPFGFIVYVIKASKHVYGCITAINVLAFDGPNPCLGSR